MPPWTRATGQHAKKRRASHVCQGCRKRKVKCDLIASGGGPCSHCREDDIACVALESKRSRRYRRQAQQHDLDQTTSNQPSSVRPGNALPLPIQHAPFPQRLPSLLNMGVGLPAYVKAVRRGFDAEDAVFLASRGASTVPDAGVRDELIRAFVLYVHPYMPVLNLQDFFHSVHGAENSNPCSLILLQAVLYAGCAFVPMLTIETLGFQTRIAARKAFYIKVKQLYEFDWEEDPIAVIQALLLITDWFETPDDPKDPWYWLGSCRILANRIGLGNNPNYERNAPKTRSLLRRLWWMCILRDRVIAISTRKPLQFRQDEITISLLTVQDFETQPVNAGIASLRDAAVLVDPGTKQTLARLCIEKINLSHWVSRIFSLNYSPFSGSQAPATSVMLYSLNSHASNFAENIDLHRRLGQWKHHLPNDCIFAAPPILSLQRTTDDEVLSLYRAELHMFSLMAFGLLYRPLLSGKMDSVDVARFSRHDVILAAEKVAYETARMARFFCEKDLVPKLPPTATTLFLSALPTFLMGIKLSSGALHDSLRLQFRWCSEAISQQRVIWPTSEIAHALVEAMVSKAQIRDTRDLIGGSSSVYHLTSNHYLSSGILQERGNVPALAPSEFSLSSGSNRLHTPAEGAVDWVSWLDFDDDLFNQFLNNSNALFSD